MAARAAPTTEEFLLAVMAASDTIKVDWRVVADKFGYSRPGDTYVNDLSPICLLNIFPCSHRFSLHTRQHSAVIMGRKQQQPNLHDNNLKWPCPHRCCVSSLLGPRNLYISPNLECSLNIFHTIPHHSKSTLSSPTISFLPLSFLVTDSHYV